MNGEHVTVQFRVDDLKVSDKDQTVLEDFLNNLGDEFGQEDKLTENKGLVHNTWTQTTLRASSSELTSLH